MATPKRLASAAARTELSRVLREFAKLDEAADSIGDRAVRLGIYNDDAAVLVPRVDFEQALALEEALDDILLELATAERLAEQPSGWKSVEEVARDLGLADDLGLE
jgi:hypothetical protein